MAYSFFVVFTFIYFSLFHVSDYTAYRFFASGGSCMLKLCLYLATHTCIFTYVAAGNICSSLSVCNTTWRCKKDESITLLEQDHCLEEKQRLKQ